MQTPSPPGESAFNGLVVQNDVLEVMVNLGDRVDFLPAVVWSVLDDGFEVYYLTRCHPMHSQPDAREQDQLLHVFEDHLNRIPWQSVNLHVPLSQFEGDEPQRRKQAFRRLGYRDLGNNKFYKISEEQLLESVPSLRGRTVEIGVMDTDSENDTEMSEDEEGEEELLDSHGNLADLVANESAVELFTEATGTAFSQEMNRAQEAFSAWQPANEREAQTKDLIDSIETRIRREEANRAWAQGRSL